MVHPANNPANAVKIDLGQRLFFETALSVNASYSCASCHDPENHYTDGRKVAVGATGQLHSRNTPTLYNVGYGASFGWDDQGIFELEQQHLIPLLNTNPIEMGYIPEYGSRLRHQPAYAEMFALAFPGQQRTNETNLTLITRALASYVRTIRHPDNQFDQYIFGDDPNALSNPAKAGLELFTSPRLGCSNCHNSFNLSGPVVYLNQVNAPDQVNAPEFHHTGVDGSTHKFRAPTLRAIRHTAPYMHAGNLSTLDDVLQHYQSTTAPAVPRFSLTPTEHAQLIAFLKTL